MGEERGMSRKGQEGISIGTLLIIVLGVVAVVIIIIGISGGFDFIFGKIDVLPGQSLQSAVQSCKIAAEQELQVDYCRTFKEVEINDIEQRVTCQFIAGENIDSSLTPSTFSCGSGVTSDSVAVKYCEDLRTAGKLNVDDDTLYNGKTCKGHGVFNVQE